LAVAVAAAITKCPHINSAKLQTARLLQTELETGIKQKESILQKMKDG
jgi:hypothetical protein